MPKRSLTGTIEHLSRIHGEAAVPAHWVIKAAEERVSAGLRRLVELVRRRAADPRVKQARRLRGEGRTNAEVASILGISERTVWNWLRRALVPRFGQGYELANVGGYAYARVVDSGSPPNAGRLLPLVALRVVCTGCPPEELERSRRREAPTGADCSQHYTSAVSGPDEQRYGEIVEAARRCEADRVVAEFPDAATTAVALKGIRELLGPDDTPRVDIDLRSRGGNGYLLAFVSHYAARRRRGEPSGCGYVTFAVARCSPEVSLVGKHGQGYCRSCKRQRVFEVQKERALPFEDAQTWLRTRNPEFLEFD